MIRAGFDSGGLYAPRAFRRGSTQEILADGSALSVIPTSWTWDVEGYKSCLDTKIDEALNITRIILEHANSDRSEDDKPPGVGRLV